jgi:polyhydroxybutyrate depolymerase
VAGSGGVRTWNAGGCCGYAVDNDIDDLGFIAAILDRLEASTCVDSRRVYAAGMSNGSMMSHRLACELADRIRAIAAVAGTDMTLSCDPARPVPVLTIHGSDDANVPFDGGLGCGLADVRFRSVPVTIARWNASDGCSGDVAATSAAGDATCSSYAKCAAGSDVELCVIAGGGHQWPGGLAPSASGLPGCPFGYQSQSFSASQQMWRFFAAHPAR